MENFSNIIKNYKIICYDERFNNLILKKYNYNKINNTNTIHIGINKLIRDNIHSVLLLGCENYMFDFFSINDKIKYYVLSKLQQEEYKKKYNINSTIINFDFEISDSDIEFNYFQNEYDNNFDKYISLCYEKNLFLFDNIKKIKYIIPEYNISINNPFLHIAYTSNKFEIINYYFLHFNQILQQFKCDKKSIYERIFYLKSNLNNMFNFLEKIKSCKIENIENKIDDPDLHNQINITYNLTEPIKNPFIIFSDNYDKLNTINDQISLKIFISNNNDILIKKIKNNFIQINKYFFEKKKKLVIQK